MRWIRRHLALTTVLFIMLFMSFVVLARPKHNRLLESVASEFPVHEIASIDDAADAMGVPSESAPPAQRGRVHYFADGRALSDPTDYNRQVNWVCMFNPAMTTASLRFTFYYENHAPTYMEYKESAKTVSVLNLYNRKEILHDRRFGAKIETSVPMIIQVTTGYFGRSDRKDMFTRALDSVICSDVLSTINYYADGIVVNEKGIRLKEGEWAFLLNPNLEVAKVVFHAYRVDGVHKTYRLDIQPQRLFPLQMHNLVADNKLFAAKFVSNVPIAVQQTRIAVEEDGKTIRAAYSTMAKPWSLPDKEAD